MSSVMGGHQEGKQVARGLFSSGNEERTPIAESGGRTNSNQRNSDSNYGESDAQRDDGGDAQGEIHIQPILSLSDSSDSDFESVQGLPEERVREDGNWFEAAEGTRVDPPLPLGLTTANVEVSTIREFFAGLEVEGQSLSLFELDVWMQR
ncbi:hypothetical protein Sjap_005359 [Stephania japonica]|uniref:Uncharacterized protein n=1 Tax=Stephania japonica TaxID=461633 RepID=A0AAP0K3T8_9MAGN